MDSTRASRRSPAEGKGAMGGRLGALLGLALAAVALAAAPAKAEDAPRVAAVFDFEFVNWSQEADYGADNTVEIRRLALISDLLRELLAESGRFELRDTGPLAERVAAVNSLRGCNGCDAGLARELGAELAITGVVNKVSNMELAIVIRARDAETKKILIEYQAEIRGNTDQSWTRGVSWIVRNRILHPDYAYAIAR